MITERSEGLDLAPDRSTWPTWFATIVEQNRRLGALPALGGNTATLIGDYQASIDAMTADVDTAEQFRARRVLHRVARRHDPRLLRRHGTGRATRRRRAGAARSHLDGALGDPQGDLRRARPHRREVELHASRAAVQGQVPATRPAQPPQDRGRRRPCRLHRLAEPDRPQLQLEEATSSAGCSGRSSWRASPVRP